MTKINSDVLAPIIRKHYEWLTTSPMAVRSDNPLHAGIGAAFMSLLDYGKATGVMLDPNMDDMLGYAKAAAKTVAEFYPQMTAMDWEEIILREAPTI